MTEELVKRSQRDTVQALPDVQQNGAGIAGGFWSEPYVRGDYLPSWGTRLREKALRQYDRDTNNTLWQGARSMLEKKFAGTPSELKGGRNTTRHFDDVLRFAQFGKGQRHLKKLVARDYLRFDGGAYVEVIAPGNPKRPPTGRVTGLAHLDSLYCFPTGDPEFPVIYYNRDGAKHILHHTRVMHFVDSPDGDQNNPGYGQCALSRAIAIVVRQINMGRYIVAKLDDKPPPGMLLVSGMTRAAWDAVWMTYGQDQSNDRRPEWGKVMPFFGVDASIAPKIESVPFATTPDKFDFKVYVELDVHELALALGVDIQDLWELTGGNLGSGQQSEVQHAKSRGNTLGDMLSMWEQALNNYVLPPSLEYEHKVRDPYEANERAQNAQTWAGFLTAAGDALTAEEKRQILANQVEAVADAIVDENGELIRLPDADRQDAGQQLEVTAGDEAPPAETLTAEPVQLQLVKDFDATRAAFTSNLADLLQGAMSDEVSRRRAGVVMRALLNTSGKAARNDGLVEGGVTTGLSEDDLNAHMVWLAEQSQYVTNFLSDAYKNGLSEAQISQHVELWANKSLQGAFYEGALSADRDGLYEFYGDDGKESCATCKGLKGTVMRMSEWTEKQLRPGLDTENYDCGGWQCQHGIRRVQRSG
jgi:hypothetical protein